MDRSVTTGATPHDGLPSGIAGARDRLATFLRDEVGPAERDRRVRSLADVDAELRRWVRRRADELGLFRLLQPRDLGGEDLGPLGHAALYEAIGASGTVLGELALGGNGGLLRLGTAVQRERFLDPVLRGEMEAAFAFTDAREGPRTTARREADAFIVDGVKSFVTNGPHADLLVTVVSVVAGGEKAGTAILVIPCTAAGVRLRRELRTLDGGVHGEFELSGVMVPTDHLIGEIGQGLPRALESITALRLRAAALACGTARFALERMIAHAARPHRTGTPLGEREQVQATLADSAADVFAMRAALFAAARRADAAAGGGAPGASRSPAGSVGETPGAASLDHVAAAVEIEVAMAKVLATEGVARVVDRAIQLEGGAAVVEDHPLAVLYRRIRAWRIGEGTTEVLRLVIARRMREGARPW